MSRVTWSQRPARVRAPATSANLGPGFDALGLALALYDEVEARVTDGGLAIEVSGEGSETAAAGEQHLVVRAMRAAFGAIGVVLSMVMIFNPAGSLLAVTAVLGVLLLVGGIALVSAGVRMRRIARA